MPAITLDVPEKLAAQITAMPDDERNQWATEVLQEALDEEALSDSEVAAIKEGISDVQEGRVHEGTSVLAGLRQIVGRVK